MPQAELEIASLGAGTRLAMEAPQRHVDSGVNQVDQVPGSAVLAAQSRVHRAEHDVYERGVGTAAGLARVGGTTELEIGPSILLLRALIPRRTRSTCSCVAQ